MRADVLVFFAALLFRAELFFAELLAFADADLSPERLDRVKKHLEGCGPCAQQVKALAELIGDIVAPLGDVRFDVDEHAPASQFVKDQVEFKISKSVFHYHLKRGFPADLTDLDRKQPLAEENPTSRQEVRQA